MNKHNGVENGKNVRALCTRGRMAETMDPLTQRTGGLWQRRTRTALETRSAAVPFPCRRIRSFLDDDEYAHTHTHTHSRRTIIQRGWRGRRRKSLDVTLWYTRVLLSFWTPSTRRRPRRTRLLNNGVF